MAALQVSSPACSSFAASPVPALTRAEQALEAALADGAGAQLSAAIHAAVKVLGSADASDSRVPQVGIGPAYLETLRYRPICHARCLKYYQLLGRSC